MESVKTIRAVERAFEVLSALQAVPEGASLAQLQQRTGLAKPTLLRLIKTLVGVGVVRRGMVDQRYRTTLQLDVLARGGTLSDHLSDLAAPILDVLCRELEWPSDLLTHQGSDDFLTVLESSLRRSRFYVRRRPGRLRVNLLGSAAGSAYLAWLPEERRASLLQAARQGRDIHNLKILAAGTWREHLARARARGYATRHPYYRGGSYNAEPRDDALSSLAVPLIVQGQVIGSLNINWNRQALTEDDMAARSVERLRQAADTIARAAVQHGLLASGYDA